MQALALGDHLASLLPDPAIRPVDRVRLAGGERRRAGGKRSNPTEWQWAEDGEDG